MNLRGMRPVAATVLLGSALCAAPVRAELVSESEAGFVSRATVDVRGTPDAIWPVMTTPSQWWLDRHTYSGSAANLVLNPTAGGCFCEKLPPSSASKSGKPGSVEHMRVVYAQPGEALRMVGALGPLQSEAMSGTLTLTMKPVTGGTRITMTYVVGGFGRYKHDEIAKSVDAVMTSQLAHLGERLGVLGSPEKPAAKPASKPAAAANKPNEDHKAAEAAFDKAMAKKSGAAAKPAAAKPATTARPAAKPAAKPTATTGTKPAVRPTPKPT